MDSLLASYASSDEEDDHHHHQQQPQPTTLTHLPPPSISSTTSSLFSSLPKPQSSSPPSFFSSLPPPKSSSTIPSSFQVEDSKPPPKSSAFFSSIPPPKTQTTPDFPLQPPNPKKVVQFRPPLPQSISKFDDDEDEDEEDEEERERKKKRQMGQDTSVKSFLSSMPNPKNSMGSGSGRRSIIETNEPTPLSSDANEVKSEVGFESNLGNGQENWVDGSHSYNYEVGVTGDQSYVGYEGYDVYGSSGYDTYGSYDASSGATVVETSKPVESFVNMGGKRRKDQPPPEIVEVKQDELIKDRPREDKSKLTGIAFGPSYQPASTKGKPSKLHKRKHQIGALYFDMRQKEMELAERRSKGLLTKAETQAKYGW